MRGHDFAMKLIALPLVASLLAACAAATPPAPAELAPGRYDLVAVDGTPVVNPAAERGEWQKAQFGFGTRSYGGDAGCNSLGGLYVQVEGRFYTMPGPQTAMMCAGRPMEQEDIANAVFTSAPAIANGGNGEIVLSGAGHSLTLRKVSDAAPQDAPTAWQSPTLAGQTFVVEAIGLDRIPGEQIYGKNPPKLAFAKERVNLRVDCPAAVSASFVESGEGLSIGTFAAPCAKGARDRALAAILEAGPRYTSGPNGELLIASSAGWAQLSNVRRDRPK